MPNEQRHSETTVSSRCCNALKITCSLHVDISLVGNIYYCILDGFIIVLYSLLYVLHLLLGGKKITRTGNLNQIKY